MTALEDLTPFSIANTGDTSTSALVAEVVTLVTSELQNAAIGDAGDIVNVSENVSDYNYELTLFDKPVWHLTVIGIVYGILVVLTVVGNVFVMVAYHRDIRIRRSVANTFILNLAIADFIVGAFIWPIYLAWNLVGVWIFGEYLCKVWSFVDYTVTAVSVVTIIFISLDRFWLLSKASAYASFQTRRRVNVTIATCWLVTCAIFLTVVFGWSTFTGQEPVEYQYSCDAEFIYTFPSLISAVVLNFAVPAVIIAVLNIMVYYKIRERARGLNQLKSKIKRESTGKRERSKPIFQMRLNVFKKGKDCTLPAAGKVEEKGLSTGVILLSIQNGHTTECHSNPSFEPKADMSSASSGGTSGIGSAKEDGSVSSEEADDPGQQNNDIEGVDEDSSKTKQTVFSVSASSSSKDEPEVKNQKRSPTKAKSLNLENLKKKLKQKQREFNRERRAAFILAVLVSVFVLCWLPFNLTVIVGVICNYECIPEDLFVVTENLVWANSALNPILYAATNVHFRRNFLTFLGCGRMANKLTVPTSVA